jgi:hypothetical protein
VCRNILPYEMYLYGNEYRHLLNSTAIDSTVNSDRVVELIDDMEVNDQSSTADVRESVVVNAGGML